MKTRDIVIIIGAIIGLIGAITAAIIIARCSIQNKPDNIDVGINPNDSNKTITETKPIDPLVQKKDLNFRGWYPWGELQANNNKNTVTFKGRVTDAGYVNEKLDRSLRNKTIILEFKNISSSNFNQDRLIKITVNANDQLVYPNGITDLVEDEYVPIDYDKVEFVLPNNFDGKIGFVFHHADLNDLEITAYYK
jgi:hypothetical protein